MKGEMKPRNFCEFSGSLWHFKTKKTAAVASLFKTTNAWKLKNLFHSFKETAC